MEDSTGKGLSFAVHKENNLVIVYCCGSTPKLPSWGWLLPCCSLFKLLVWLFTAEKGLYLHRYDTPPKK